MASDKENKSDKNPSDKNPEKNPKDRSHKEEPEAKKAAPKEASAKASKPAKAAASKKEESASKAEAKPKAPRSEKKGTPGPKRAPLAERTYFAKVGEKGMNWKLVDAAGVPLGRLSSHIAMLLMGKTNPYYSPSVDTGDHVVVVNATKVVLTGKKWDTKVYHHHTGFPGGIKTTTAREVRDRNPERLIERAVWRMLPKFKGHMVHHWFKKLRVFPGPEHTHTAQNPQPVKLPNLGFHERT